MWEARGLLRYWIKSLLFPRSHLSKKEVGNISTALHVALAVRLGFELRGCARFGVDVQRREGGETLLVG